MSSRISLIPTNLFFILMLLFGLLFQWFMLRINHGLSIPITVVLFYLLYLGRLSTQHTHFQMSTFVFVCIMLISCSYAVWTNSGLLSWSLLVLPFLIGFHLLLMTSPHLLKWYKWSFIIYVFAFIGYTFHYLMRYTYAWNRRIKQKVEPSTYSTVKMVALGLVVSIPLVFFVSLLLISADEAFGRLVLSFPNWISTFEWSEHFFRLFFGLCVGLFTFGFIQAIRQSTYREKYRIPVKSETTWNEVFCLTILFSLNVLYLLFVSVQFQYFFSETIQEGLSFAEYARRGFFELIFVTLINWTMFLSVTHFVRPIQPLMKSVIKVLLSLMICSSGVMLVSAFIRLMLYEQEYGFTTTRFLVHSFMIFLSIIFTYSLVKVWIERLSLARFYFLTALVSFTLLHVINMDGIIATQNLQRYTVTETIDLPYLESLSGAGTLALLDLYKRDPAYANLENLLEQKHQEFNRSESSWLSYTFIDAYAKEQLAKKLFD